MINLTKLLAVGRSIIGIAPAPKAYKVVGEEFLPKFGRPARAEPAPAKTNPSPSPAGQPAAARHDPPTPVSATKAALRASIAAPTPASPPSKVAAQPASTAAVATVEPSPKAPALAKKSTGARMLQGLNPFAGRGQPRPTRAWVQAELSLQAVKVMRNDLRDADLEVVEAAATPAREGVVAAAAIGLGQEGEGHGSKSAGVEKAGTEVMLAGNVNKL